MSEQTNDEPREGEQDEQDERSEQGDATPEPVNPQVGANEQGLTTEATGQPPDSGPKDEDDDED